MKSGWRFGILSADSKSFQYWNKPQLIHSFNSVYTESKMAQKDISDYEELIKGDLLILRQDLSNTVQVLCCAPVDPKVKVSF